MTDLPTVLLPNYVRQSIQKQGISEYHQLHRFFNVYSALSVQRTLVEWMVINISGVR